jgi:hypothetical protein
MNARDELDWLRLTQFGVVSREQALTAGLTESGLRHRIRPGGPWQRMLPGVYLMSTGAATVSQREAAAFLYAGPESRLTGPAALRFYEIWTEDHDQVDVLVADGRPRASCGYVVVHRTRRMPGACSHRRVIAYVPAERAVADAVRGLDRLADARTVVASAVQRRRCSVDQLARELAARRSAGNGLLRTVLAEVADGIRSAPEGDLRGLVNRAGLPAPLYNPRLYLNGEFLARPDAWWQAAAVAVEVDSMQFHLLPRDWEDTMRRHSRMTAAGLLVLHYSPFQLRSEPDLVVREIMAALAAGRPAAGITTRPDAA